MKLFPARGFPAKRSASPENPSTSLSNPDAWFYEAVGATPNVSGVPVSERTSLQVLAVYACVRIIAETVASLPLITYERKGRGKDRANAHPVYSILHDRPNPEISAMAFREMLQAHVLIWGNAYAEIETNKAGTVIGLWPLLPDRTWCERINGQRVYYTRVNGEAIPLTADRVFHLPGLSFDGLSGYSPIQLAKNAIGLTSATEQFGASFFARGAALSGVLEHPKTLNEEAVKRLQQSFSDSSTGLTNWHRVKVLEEGMQWKQTGIPNNHAQFLETRKFQLGEIARLFRVPPHMLADLENGASYASVEQMSQDFVTYTLRPWLVRWEQALNYDLFGARERATYFAEHLVDGLLRGDQESRYASYAVGRQWGWLSANDVRELENMNPLPGDQGDIYITPLNMIPADQVGQPPAKDTPTDAPADPQAKQYKSLLLDVGDRMVKRELPQLRKALKQGEAAWNQGVEAIYREHGEAFTKALTPVFDALLAFGPPEARTLSKAARGLAAELAADELTESRRELDAAGYAGANDLLATWERDRAERFAVRAVEFLTSLLHKPELRAA